jgi:hypothetical protein
VYLPEGSDWASGVGRANFVRRRIC